jgi:Uma2 family endonuclease
MSLLTSQPPRTKRWTAKDYWRMAERGDFDGQRVQLINGEIIEMPPQGHAHTLSKSRVVRFLMSEFEPKHWVRTESSLPILATTVPEPDIAVAEHPIEWYQEHPVTALLVVEISDSSLRLDRQKANLYALAGIPEYWIVNVVDRTVEVYRKPKRDSKSESGYTYSEKKILKTTDSISSLARPKAKIEVKRFFE